MNKAKNNAILNSTDFLTTIKKDEFVEQIKEENRLKLDKIRHTQKRSVEKYVSPMDEILFGDKKVPTYINEKKENDQQFNWKNIEDIRDLLDTTDLKIIPIRQVSDEEIKQAIFNSIEEDKVNDNKDDIIIPLDDEMADVQSSLEYIMKSPKLVSDEEIYCAIDCEEKIPFEDITFIEDEIKKEENSIKTDEAVSFIEEEIKPEILNIDQNVELDIVDTKKEEETMFEIEIKEQIKEVEIKNNELGIIEDKSDISDDFNEFDEFDDLLPMPEKQINISPKTFIPMDLAEINPQWAQIMTETREKIAEQERITRFKHLVFGAGISISLSLLFTFNLPNKSVDSKNQLLSEPVVYYKIPEYPIKKVTKSLESTNVESLLTKPVQNSWDENKIPAKERTETNLFNKSVKNKALNQIDQSKKFTLSEPIKKKTFVKKLVSKSKIPNFYTRNKLQDIPDVKNINLSSPYVSMNLLAYAKNITINNANSVDSSIQLLIDNYVIKLRNSVNLKDLLPNYKILDKLAKFPLKDNYTKFEWEEIIKIITTSLPTEIAYNLHGNNLITVVNLILNHSQVMNIQNS